MRSVLFVSGEILHGQSLPTQGYRQVLVQKHKAFVNYANDFVDFAKSGVERSSCPLVLIARWSALERTLDRFFYDG